MTSRQIYTFLDIRYPKYLNHIKINNWKTYLKCLQRDCLQVAREWSWVSREAKKWLKAPKEAALHSTSPSWLIIGDHKYTIKERYFQAQSWKVLGFTHFVIFKSCSASTKRKSGFQPHMWWITFLGLSFFKTFWFEVFWTIMSSKLSEFFSNAQVNHEEYNAYSDLKDICVGLLRSLCSAYIKGWID